jgi:hypothetical protein
MIQITISTNSPEKEQALIQFLLTLDYVTIDSVVAQKQGTKKEAAIQNARAILKEQSSKPYRQSDVNREIKLLRKKKGYQ